MPESSPFYDSWHKRVSGFIDGDISRVQSETLFEPAPPNSGMYNATATDVRVLATRPMVWMGFPREVLIAERSNWPRPAAGGKRSAE